MASTSACVLFWGCDAAPVLNLEVYPAMQVPWPNAAADSSRASVLREEL